MERSQLALVGGDRFGLEAGVLLVGTLALHAAEVIEGTEVSALGGGDAGGDFVLATSMGATTTLRTAR